MTLEQRDEALADHAGRAEHPYLELACHSAVHSNKFRGIVEQFVSADAVRVRSVATPTRPASTAGAGARATGCAPAHGIAQHQIGLTLDAGKLRDGSIRNPAGPIKTSKLVRRAQNVRARIA